MKNSSAILLCVFFFAGISLAFQACTALTTLPLASVFGGAELAIKGAELQKEIRKADDQEAFNSPFEETWNMTLKGLENLSMEITRIKRNQQGDGGLIEARSQKIKIKIVTAKITEKITEIGIWAGNDKALASLIAQEIKEAGQKKDRRNVPDDIQFLSLP